ncbi:hypothetical protein BH18ACT8_BH18ACT8_09640 [soil metagenome]
MNCSASTPRGPDGRTVTSRRLRTWITACLPILGLILMAAAPSGASTRSGDARLTVSPGTYVAGQRVIFQGSLGRTGERRITLQLTMNRPGDEWTDIDGFSARTKADGSFRFAYPAPGMFGIRYRVVSRRLTTPAWTFDARSQDLVLHVVSGNSALNGGQVLAGVPFVINVDTTPILSRRPDLPPPIFPGRTLTLQRRVDGYRWKTLDRTVTDQLGMGKFVAVANRPGHVVYRVRQESWTKHGNKVGWFPSFPTYVRVLESSSANLAMPEPEPQPTATRSNVASLATRQNRASTTASQTYGWAPSLWDFAWETGQSLTSRPSRGTDRTGRWRDTSTGTGRAAQHNGGLMLDSQRDNVDGPGDRGTTAVTLRGNPMRYGRWEVRLRMKSTETQARDYHARVELVPDRARDYHCGARNITVADVTAHGSSVTFGAKALSGAQWSRTLRNVPINGQAIAFAVEVTKNHITWFKEGKPVGTVRSRAAVSDVPMTLRLRLVGDGQREMNRTQAISDWMRGFSLERGKRVTGGPDLRRGQFNGGC